MKYWFRIWWIIVKGILFLSLCLLSVLCVLVAVNYYWLGLEFFAPDVFGFADLLLYLWLTILFPLTFAFYVGYLFRKWVAPTS